MNTNHIEEFSIFENSVIIEENTNSTNLNCWKSEALIHIRDNFHYLCGILLYCLIVLKFALMV